MAVEAKKADSAPKVDVGDATRERILAAALPLFYDKGYKGTSLAAIAKEVGISAPALYWHFKSKRDICFAAVQDELRRFAYALRPSATEASPLSGLGQFVRSYVLLKLGQNERLKEPGALGAYRQLHDALTAKQRSQLDSLQREVRDVLTGILDAGIADGTFTVPDRTAAGYAIITMCEYVFSWAHPGGRLSAPAIADIYRDLVLSMVVTK